MADVLKCQQHEHTQATQQFIRHMDQFFDCFNVTNTFEGQKSRKPSLFPYRTIDNWRFEVYSNLCISSLD